MNEPRLRDDLPLLIGGAGEKKTFRYAARHADHLTIICHASDVPRRLDAGIDGFVFTMVTNGHVPGAVAMACEALRPLVKA